MNFLSIIKNVGTLLGGGRGAEREKERDVRNQHTQKTIQDSIRIDFIPI